MKFKNKILLASASLLVLSGAAASTGVFAWYTANRTASVTTSKITATSTEGALGIANGDGDEHGVEITSKTTDAPQDLNITPTDGAYLVDVTGDGKGTFNKPFYATATSVAGMVGHWASESAYQDNYVNTAFYYYSFDLKFSISGGEGSYGLLLSKSCTVADTSTSTTVADTIRVSANTGSRSVYANIKGTDTGYYTYSSDAWAEVASITGGTETQGVLTSTYFDAGKDATSFTTSDDSYLGTIAANGELTVTFYVWVEGHTSANTGAATDLNQAGNSDATFNLSLKFLTIKA